MTPEQVKHMDINIDDFVYKYANKYSDGQKQHGGNMWEMGAYQALENMEAEVLDQWSYVRQIRKVLDEIQDELTDFKLETDKDGKVDTTSDNFKLYFIKEILSRRKEEA